MPTEIEKLEKGKWKLIVEKRNTPINNKNALKLVDIIRRLDSIKIRLYLLKTNPAVLEKKENECEVIGFNNWPLAGTYKTISITNPYDNLPALVHYNDDEITFAHELLDILAFLYHKPLFLNEGFLENEIEIFDFISDYAEDKMECRCFKEVFKLKRSEFYVVPHIKFPPLFSLYNSALKQIDPFAKCVFLYRIIEYYHQNIISTRVSTKIFFNNQISLLSKHHFLPVVIENLIGEQKKNLVLTWKKRLKYVLDNNLGNLTPFDYVYPNGRCGVAHGRGIPNPLIYHTKENYNKISNINLILNLVCRFLIEKEETDLRKSLNFKI